MHHSVHLIAFWIRVQGLEHLSAAQFTETDGYFCYYQASLISEHGKLPARDMHRWLPIGRDLGQTLNLYGYIPAYTHKAVAWIFPNLTLYDICLYIPVICFSIGLGALCLYLYHFSIDNLQGGADTHWTSFWFKNTAVIREDSHAGTDCCLCKINKSDVASLQVSGRAR